nr:hypothetical protein [uncultured Flavobacterium sp.]
MTKKKLSFDLNNITKWAEINWIKFEIYTSIDALKKLVILQNEGFEIVHKDLNNKISEVRSLNKQMDEQNLDQYITHLYGIDEEIISELKRIQNISKVISIFAILESKLKVIRDKIQNDFKPNFELKKTNSVFLGHWKFLRLFLNDKIVKSEKYFTPIFNQMEVRNIFNHQDGIATKEQYDKLLHIEGLKFREFEKMFYLENIEEIFIENLFLKIESFLNELLKELQDRTNEIVK